MADILEFRRREPPRPGKWKFDVEASAGSVVLALYPPDKGFDVISARSTAATAIEIGGKLLVAAVAAEPGARADVAAELRKVLARMEGR